MKSNPDVNKDFSFANIWQVVYIWLAAIYMAVTLKVPKHTG